MSPHLVSLSRVPHPRPITLDSIRANYRHNRHSAGHTKMCLQMKRLIYAICDCCDALS